MSPIQQLLLGTGAAAKTYVDDVFRSYPYQGTETSRLINTGMNMSGKGGLVWIKVRNDTTQHHLYDTARGANYNLASDADSDTGTAANRLTAFNSNGFTLGTAGQVNGTSAYKYSSWSFRKSKGFFDIVTWTGNGSNRNISHGLGCKPGVIMIKRHDDPSDWVVYHKGFYQFQGSNHYYLKLNSTSDQFFSNTVWNNTAPTDTTFRVGTSDLVNKLNGQYIAYVFAGGESDESDAVSVQFDGSDDKLTLAATSDLVFGTGAYTVEFWIKYEGTASIIFSQYTDANGGFVISSTSTAISINQFGVGDVLSVNTTPEKQWTHYAFVREGTGSNQTKIYKNGTAIKTGTDSTNWNISAISAIGGNAHPSSTQYTGCKISNFRIVKGTAVYTSDFKVPTEPLTNITNTKLLCCNNSSATGSTVTPGTITAVSSPTAHIDSPFFSKEHYQFGEEGNSDIIKAGYYVGNGDDDKDIDVYLGWEPQWLLVKQAGNNGNWQIVDSSTSWPVQGNWETIRPNIASGAVVNNTETGIWLTSTGFRIVKNWGNFNTNNDQHIFLAIRRPDGYVGKPPELGTDVFAMDTGAGGSTVPGFDSGFPVDFALARRPASTDDWYTYSRLTGLRYLRANVAGLDGNDTNAAWDSNAGWYTAINSNYQSWMWKRHAGFDFVHYKGYEVQGIRSIPHNLGRVPEMIWLKARDYDSGGWAVYHKGFNGGTNPEQWYTRLNVAEAESDWDGAWADVAPTSTHWTVGNDNAGNGTYNYIAMLFASVDGISKVGYYDGSDSDQTITTGFQPRFVIVKCIDQSSQNEWCVWDTTRGWGSGSDSRLKLDSTAVASTTVDVGTPTSTGFTVGGGQNSWNNTGRKYIYYAHA